LKVSAAKLASIMLITLTVDGWCVFCQIFFFPRVTGAQQKQNSAARLALEQR
jgi:hypothetical protein